MFPPCPISTAHSSDKVSLAAFANVPTVHVPARYVVAPEGAALTKVVPAGHVSVIAKFVACAGPLLLTSIE